MSGQYRNIPLSGMGLGGTATEKLLPEKLWYDKQPYPLFAAYSNYAGTNPDLSVFDSDFRLISRNQQSGIGYSRANESEIFSNYLTHLSTNGSIGTGKVESFGCKGTSMVQADGHQLLAVTSNGSIAARNLDKTSEVFTNSGIIVGPEGYRQPMSIQARASKITQSARGTPNVRDMQDDLFTAKYSKPSWNTYNTTDARGMCSYNANTDKLAIIEPIGVDEGDYRAHIYHNPNRKLTGNSGELNLFILEAKNKIAGGTYVYFDFTMSSSGAKATEAHRRLRIILSNDDKLLICRFKAPTDISLWYIQIPEVSSSAEALIYGTGIKPTFITSQSVFNTLDNTNGDYYGTRHQVTWDNKWVALYVPYYYYLTGLSGLVVNMDDPVNWNFKLTYATYDYAITTLPLGKSGFIFGVDANQDGTQGACFSTLSFSDPVKDPLDQSKTICHVNGKVTSKASALIDVFSSGMLDVAYTGNNYPCLVPVDN